MFFHSSGLGFSRVTRTYKIHFRLNGRTNPTQAYIFSLLESGILRAVNAEVQATRTAACDGRIVHQQ